MPNQWNFTSATLNHFRFVIYHNISVKENVIFSARESLRDTDINASSVVWILIDNGKLANQIARLAAIVVKIKFPAHVQLV